MSTDKSDIIECGNTTTDNCSVNWSGTVTSNVTAGSKTTKDSWDIADKISNEIVNYSVISANCKKVIVECMNTGIDSFEKELRYERK